MKTTPMASRSLTALLGFAALAANLIGQTSSPIQSPARPLGLGIVAPVQQAGSDKAASNFQSKSLPPIQSLVDVRLGERVAVNNATAFSLDPTKLRMATESTARVYFVGEGAGYRNSLGFNTLAAGQATPRSIITNNAKLIFPDASSSVSSYDPAANVRRTASTPLLPGDFVDLGNFKSGTTLDFFVVANGASGGTTAYAAPASRNPDKMQHVVAFAFANSPFLIIGFEDLFGGGDKDYNDVIFAVDIGAVNVQRLISTPEPRLWLVLAMFGCGIIWQRRRTWWTAKIA